MLLLRDSNFIHMKSKIKVLFFLAVLLASQTVISQNNIIDEIVWVVGDEAIL